MEYRVFNPDGTITTIINTSERMDRPDYWNEGNVTKKIITTYTTKNIFEKKLPGNLGPGV
jgi:hypothetical protein